MNYNENECYIKDEKNIVIELLPIEGMNNLTKANTCQLNQISD
jgi:hypothetical protein